MNPVTTALTLNMQLPNIAAVAWAVQGDIQSRQISATLVDGGSAWNPQAGYHGIIRYFKPDGTNGVYDTDEGGATAVTWSGNIATIKIAQQALTVAGTVIMQLEFYDSNDARVSTFGWAMNVQPSAVTDTEFLSTDYYSILSLQISGVLGASSHPPYINSSTHNWMVWDENASAYVDSGYSSVGATGPYFTPAVDTSGNISWTNNGGLSNPTTRNIKGPQGVSVSSVTKASGTGAPGTSDTYNVNLSNGTVGGTFTVYNGSDGTGSPGSQPPLMDGTATVGTATAYSREDHRHPTDTRLKVLKLTSQTLTGTLTNETITGSSGVTASMVVVGVEVVNAAELIEDATWSVAAGSLKISGKFGSTGTAIIFYLEEADGSTNATGTIKATAAKLGNYTGYIFSGDVVRGYGNASYHAENGVIKIEFTFKITTAGTSSSLFNCGIPTSIFDNLIGKTITPKAVGNVLYFTSSGYFSNNNVVYSGVIIPDANNTMWRFGRLYTTDGSTGVWPENRYSVDLVVTGTCYGTY